MCDRLDKLESSLKETRSVSGTPGSGAEPEGLVRLDPARDAWVTQPIAQKRRRCWSFLLGNPGNPGNPDF